MQNFIYYNQPSNSPKQQSANPENIDKRAEKPPQNLDAAIKKVQEKVSVAKGLLEKAVTMNPPAVNDSERNAIQNKLGEIMARSKNSPDVNAIKDFVRNLKNLFANFAKRGVTAPETRTVDTIAKNAGTELVNSKFAKTEFAPAIATPTKTPIDNLPEPLRKGFEESSKRNAETFKNMTNLPPITPTTIGNLNPQSPAEVPNSNPSV